MKRRQYLAQLLLLIGSLFVGAVHAQGVPECLAWNQGQTGSNLDQQCTQLRLMLVDLNATRANVANARSDEANDAIHNVEGLISGMFVDSKQVATAVFNTSRPGGFIKLLAKDVCRSYYVYAFDVNMGYSTGIRESQEGRLGSFQKAPHRVDNAPLVVLRGSNGEVVRPAETFLLQICGGEGGLNVPVRWLTPNTFVLLCPIERPLFPGRAVDGLPLGHHFKPEEVRRLIARATGAEKGTGHALFVLIY